MDKPAISTTPEMTETILPTLERKWYCKNQIVAYKSTDGTQTGITQWAAVASETIRTWPTGKPYLAVHDISYPRVGLTYVTVFKNILRLAVTSKETDAIEEFIQGIPDFKAKIALLVSLQFSGNLTSVFATLEARAQKPQSIDFAIFTDEQKALNWLGSSLSLDA